MKKNMLVDYFVPKLEDVGKEHQRRSRVSIMVNFSGIVYAVLSCVIYYFTGFKPGFFVMLGLIASLIMALFLFRSGISKNTNGNFISVCLVILISLFCSYSGGVASPGIIFFALVPMLVLIMVGGKGGIIWCGIVSAAILSLYFLELLGYPFHKLNDGMVEKYIYISTSIGFIYILYFIINISQESEKKANRQLEEKNKELDQSFSELKNAQAMLVQSEKMSSLGLLTAGVAHEINNPINFVSANIGPLKRDIDLIMSLLEKYSFLDKDNSENKLDEILKIKDQYDLKYTIEEIKLLIKGIEEGSRRTAEIVKGLRNFSRVDNENMEKVNINEGIESTLVLLQNKIKHKNITVSNMFGDLPKILCYPGQLDQVYLNLLSNSIDAIENNEPSVKHKVISITTSQENNYIKVSIKDTGKGMDEDIKKRIFDPFFTTKDVGKGTGLGLFISYGIIEKHKGRIKVKSELGKGTQFDIFLPILEDSSIFNKK